MKKSIYEKDWINKVLASEKEKIRQQKEDELTETKKEKREQVPHHIRFKESMKLATKKWRENNPESYKKSVDKTYKKLRKSPIHKVKHNLRTRLNAVLRLGKFKKEGKTADYLGCDYETFINHLESQFVEGMSWDNHTKDGWHIDHIIPLHTAKTTERIYELFHYTNLRPLWAKDNQTRPKKTSKKNL